MPNLDPENMTQPMGPLEEGDQAVVDALHRLPEHAAGEPEALLTSHDTDGTTTLVERGRFANEDSAKGYVSRPDGSSETVAAVVNPTLGKDAVSVSMGNSYAGGTPDVVHVSGNDTDRAQAQALKLEAADKINTMREHVGEAGVKAAQQ